MTTRVSALQDTFRFVTCLARHDGKVQGKRRMKR